MTEPGATFARFDIWMREAALPFWASVGHDGPGLGFVEHMTLEGRPAPVDYKRVRVQARQIYVFSHAAVLGWTGGLPAATDSFEFLCRHGLREDGGWVRRMGRRGGVVDPSADLYDLAFVLFAFAWYHRATGRAEPIALAKRTLDWIGATMRAPRQPGFENAWPVEPGPLQQNPHMHLLEATLALYEATGADCFAQVADEILTLFETRLFDERSGTLAELFDREWRRLPDARAGAVIVEPGHQFEWCWLLHAAKRLLGRDLCHAAARMHRFAAQAGTDAATGLAFDGVREDGSAPDRNTRLWPQTEAIKSYLAMEGARGEAAGPAVDRILDALMARFLGPAPAGTWIDHTTAEGVSRMDKIPTSSLYHIFFAYAELVRLGFIPS